jgi:hypothetical protein
VQDKSQLLRQLQQTIRQLHACDATHLETVHVTESFQGKTIWDGDVEIFETEGHPRVTKFYTWRFKAKDGKDRTAAIPGLRPIRTASDAVRVFIMAENKDAGTIT